jgi:tetratricopeptide (TPR) repeat protein
MLMAGLILAETNKTDEAIEVLQKLPAGKTTSEEAILGATALADCLMKTGNLESAESILRSLLDLPEGEPTPCGVSFQLALAQAGQGRLAEAAQRLSSIPRHTDCSHLFEDSALATAALLLNLNQPILATEQLESFLQANPSAESSGKLRVILATSHLRAKQYEKAQAVMERLIADEGGIDNWPQALYYDGLCRFHAGQHEKAEKRFRQFRDKGKPFQLVPLARYLEATSALRAENLVDAGQRYETFYELWPDTPLSVAALYRAGLASLANGNYENSIVLLETLDQKHAPVSEDMPGKYFVGAARLRTGDLEGASEAFRFLLQYDPRFELARRAHFQVGMIEFVLGRYDSAADILGDLPPGFNATGLGDSAAFFAAAARYKMGRYESAAAGFHGLPSMFPDSPLAIESVFWAGVCEEKLGHPREAIVLYEETGRQAGHTDVGKDAMYGLAWTELGFADIEKAKAAFEWLAEESSRIQFAEQAHFWKGRLNYAEGRWQEAIESLLHLNSLYPHSRLADAGLFFAARATRKSSDYDGAIRLFEKLIEEYPESAFIEQAEIESAECMIEAGMAGTAAHRFEQFIQNRLDSPLRPLALYDMGRALQRAGEFENAIEQYKAAAGDETTELAARCRFAIAECLAELDRGGEATAELIGMAQGGFPIGWGARARLQVARLLEREGRNEEARQIYSTVAVEYADDAAGMVAMKAVERIDSDTLITAER